MRRSILALGVIVSASVYLTALERTSTHQRSRPARETRPQPQGAIRPVHNAGKLLKETALVKVHLSTVSGRCTPNVAYVALVFKVDERYQISNQPSYWSVIDDVVTPAVIAECGGAQSIRIDNYVDAYRLAAEQRGAPRVYERSEPFMTRAEQTSVSSRAARGDATEAPLNHASLTIGSRGNPARRFFTNDRNPARDDLLSIVDARATFDRYTATRDADRQRRVAASPLAGDAQTAPDWLVRTELPQRSAAAAQTTSSAIGLKSELRYTIEPVLAMVRGWTPARMRGDVSFLPYAYEDLLGDAFAGKFEKWLGRAPHWPDGLQDRAQGSLLDVAVLAYHTSFEQQCRFVPGKWIEWERYSSSQQTNRFGPVGPAFTFHRTSVVREPFFPAFRVRAEQRRGGTLDSSAEGTLSMLGSGVRSAASGRTLRILGLPNQGWFERDFKMLIEKLGCTSDATQQLEINLHLLADGFPPLQELVRGAVK